MNGTWLIVSFGGNKWGYIDNRHQLHYLPWEYPNKEAAKNALIGYINNRQAKSKWHIHKNDVVEDLIAAAQG